MSWAVGYREGRWIGYGVPALCDHPGCSERIDRGLDFACGGGVMEDVPNCGLFFCDSHLTYVEHDDENGERQGWVCERCAADESGFDPTPDLAEWVEHMLTDESWEQWRQENVTRLPMMREALHAALPPATAPLSDEQPSEAPGGHCDDERAGEGRE